MSVNTTNGYGRISISEEAIAQIAGHSALECYGIIDLLASRFSDSVAGLFKRGQGQKGKGKGVRVLCNGDRIFIDLYVVMKYGLSIEAVAEALKKSVKYDVEKFTGMIVDTINVNVVDTGV